MSDCIFCAIAAGGTAAHLILADEQTVAFLDARPVFKGHVLVVPRAHYVTLADLPADLVEPFFGTVKLISAVLPAALGAQGTFIGLNNVVSQSVPHLHAHVVPRTKGDGLRGFFWPRQRYSDEEEAASYASRIRAALEKNVLQAAPDNGRLCRQRNGCHANRAYPERHGAVVVSGGVRLTTASRAALEGLAPHPAR